MVMPKDSIYAERFSYSTAKAEAKCETVVSHTACPALRIEKSGANHPLIVLAECLKCRKKNHLQIAEHIVKQY